MLEKMAEIKPILIDRVAQWNNEHATAAENDSRGVIPMQWSSKRDPSPQPGIPIADGERMIAEEMGKWQEFRASRAREDEKDRQYAVGVERKQSATTNTASVAVAAAQKAAGVPLEDENAELSRHQRQQDEMRLREQEIVRKRDMKRYEHQDGIAQRQQEADETARSVRQTIAVNNPGVTVTSAPPIVYSASSSSVTPISGMPGDRIPTASISRPASFHEPPRLPLENPARYEFEDSESMNTDWPGAARPRHRVEYPRTPTRALPARRCVL